MVMKYFKLSEFAVSASFPHLAKLPTGSIANNVEYLVEVCLDPLRERWGKPIVVTSGYRSQALNHSVGGSSTSAHLSGLAADVVTGNRRSDNAKLAALLVQSGLPFDQVILEKGTIASPQWVHIGISRVRNRHQILYYDGKRYRAARLVGGVFVC